MNHTIHIEKIIHGGQGLGRLENGIVVMTPFVLPNEEILVAEIKKQRGYIEAETVEILSPSPDRVEPLCKYYMQCGGCDLQHMSLAAQHKAKENIIRETLNRAGVTLEEHTICPTITSPKPFHYRYRIRLKISPEGVVGFHQAGSNTIIEIEYCHVATDILNSALDELQNSSLIKEIAQVTREIELLHSPSDNQVFCVLHLHKNKSYPQEKITSHLSSLNVITAIAIKKGREILSQLPETWKNTISNRILTHQPVANHFLLPGLQAVFHKVMLNRMYNLSNWPVVWQKTVKTRKFWIFSAAWGTSPFPLQFKVP